MTAPVRRLEVVRTEDKPSTLAKKIADVMAEVEAIPKNGKFTVGREVRYNYVQAVDLYEAVRGKLAERGVAFHAHFVGIEFERETKTSGGSTMYTTGVRVQLSLTDADTGESRMADWLGVGQDTGDKGVPKAFTGAIKTWLLATFLVPSENDEDHGGPAAKAKTARKPTDDERKKLAAHLKAYIRDGRRSDDEKQVRLVLTKLGCKDVADYNKAVVGLDRDKAVQLFQWLDGELVKRQGAET